MAGPQAPTIDCAPAAAAGTQPADCDSAAAARRRASGAAASPSHWGRFDLAVTPALRRQLQAVADDAEHDQVWPAAPPRGMHAPMRPLSAPCEVRQGSTPTDRQAATPSWQRLLTTATGSAGAMQAACRCRPRAMAPGAGRMRGGQVRAHGASNAPRPVCCGEPHAQQRPQGAVSSVERAAPTPTGR